MTSALETIYTKLWKFILAKRGILLCHIMCFSVQNESEITDFAATGNAERGWIETDPNDEKYLTNGGKYEWIRCRSRR